MVPDSSPDGDKKFTNQEKKKEKKKKEDCPSHVYKHSIIL